MTHKLSVNLKQHINHSVSAFNNIDTNIKIGLMGACIAFASIVSIYAMSLLWLGTGDSPQHLDYVWQLSRGQIPNFEDAIQYQPIEERSNYSVQYVSQHPPLFYAVLTPFLHGHLESGEWHKAVALGRSISILIGLFCLIAFSWAGYTFGGARKKFFSVALPVVAMFYGSVIYVSGDIRGDLLAVLFSVIAFTIIYKLLKNGPSPTYIITLIILSSLGMASRASYIATLLITLVALVASYFIHRKNIKRALVKGALVASGMLIFVLISIGWFYYYHNYLNSGDWTRSGAQSWISDIREYKSPGAILTDKKLYYSAVQIYDTSFSPDIYFIAIMIVLFSAIIWFYRNTNLSRLYTHKPLFIILLLFIIHFGIIAFGQIQHAVGYGKLDPRYFIATIFPLSFAVVYGLSSIKRTKGQLITFFACINIVSFIPVYFEYMDRKVSKSGYEGLSVWSRLVKTFNVNGIPYPEEVLMLLTGGAIIGFILISYSLWVLSDERPNQTNNKPGGVR